MEKILWDVALIKDGDESSRWLLPLVPVLRATSHVPFAVRLRLVGWHF